MKNLIVIVLSGLLFHTLVFGQKGKVSTFTNVGKGGSLEVSLNSGNITVVSWDKNEVSILPKGYYEDEEFPLKISKDGNYFRVSEKGSASYSSDVDVVINIPSQFNVYIRTSSGDLTLKGSFSGEMKGVTYGGDIRIDKVNGKVDFNTSGGDITTSDITGDVDVNTYGGDIKMGSISGKAEVTTSGGDIVLKNVGKYLNAVTYGGDIKIGHLSSNADISTSGGDISVSEISGDAKINTYGGDIVINGATGFTEAKTSGGDLHFWNITGSVDASTYGGDIDLQINPRLNKRTKINSAQGDINLYIPENAKATIEARIKYHGIMDHDDQFSIRSEYKYKSYEKSKNKNEIKAIYVLNGGGELISLETIDSNINIQKSVKENKKED